MVRLFLFWLNTERLILLSETEISLRRVKTEVNTSLPSFLYHHAYHQWSHWFAYWAPIGSRICEIINPSSCVAPPLNYFYCCILYCFWLFSKAKCLKKKKQLLLKTNKNEMQQKYINIHCSYLDLFFHYMHEIFII